jgi:TIR domain
MLRAFKSPSAKGEMAESKQHLANDVKQRRVYDQKIRELENQLLQQASMTFIPTLKGDESGVVHDFFISHASEDKAEFVDDLVAKAHLRGLDVWYDNSVLEWGDSLRQKIDQGLSGVYFGVVVLSENFFKKPWPQYELDGLVQKDMLGTGRLLPIWHKVTVDEVAKHTPSLAGRLALNTALNSADEIVLELIKMRDKFRPSSDDVAPADVLPFLENAGNELPPPDDEI